MLSKVVEVDKIADSYYPFISDDIKSLVRASKNQEYIVEHKKEYIKLFLELGIANPNLYLETYVNQTYGYWYPDSPYWVFAVNRNDDQFDFSETVASNTYNNFMDSYSNAYKHTPFLGLFWSIGMNV